MGGATYFDFKNYKFDRITNSELPKFIEFAAIENAVKHGKTVVFNNIILENDDDEDQYVKYPSLALSFGLGIHSNKKALLGGLIGGGGLQWGDDLQGVIITEDNKMEFTSLL